MKYIKFRTSIYIVNDTHIGILVSSESEISSFILMDDEGLELTRVKQNQ